MSDYLAIIYMATGSSHARGPSKDDAIARVQKNFISDWSSLFDVKGKPAKVAVYDADGHDNLHWDHRGVWCENESIPLLEVVDVTLPNR